jgi:anti-sigma B factor antagonist
VPVVRYLRTMINGVPVVSTPAEIDVTTSDELRAVLREATSGGHPAVLVDMTGTGFCDSAGVHTLLGAYQQLEGEGRDLRLVVPKEGAVRRVLDLTGVDGCVPCFVSVAEALAGTFDTGHPPGGAGRPGTDQSRIGS